MPQAQDRGGETGEEADSEQDMMDWNANNDGNGTEDEEDTRKMAAQPQIDNLEGANEEAKVEADMEANDGSDEDSLGNESETDDSKSKSDGDESVATLPNDNQTTQNNQKERPPPDDRNIKQFRQYCKKGMTSFIRLNKRQVRGVKLLDILRKNKTPLTAYDDLLGWYFDETGKRVGNEPIGEVPDYMSRDRLMTFLKQRYNMTDKFPFERKIVLPHSGAKVSVVCMEARNCVWRLLADPRLTDDDFCFYDNDPLAPPPEKMTKVGQLNTGEAYRNAYSKYIKDPEKQMGVGIQWYIDGAVTGQFDNLSVTALKMSLSCFTLEYRKKDHAWETIGFVVNYSAGKSKGKQMFANTEHDQALEDLLNFEHLGVNEGHGNPKISKAQDFHAQLDTILSSYLPLETKGMLWDLHYRGKLYRNIELVFWTVMVRADTDEAEKHCGKYRSRTGMVKHLCRYCHCPREETDDPKADYQAKTKTEIQQLIKNKDKDGLKDISQHYIDNAWYKLRFDPKHKTSIHGACPSEMLHALLLGIFLYVREAFFAQIGPTSQVASLIDALASQYGELFGHNSDRTLPGCKFSHGIKQKKKLMAMEYRGVLLLIATVLRSTKGYELLRDNPHFGTPGHRKDWILLVETLLEWEAFLNQKEMKLSVVNRLERKHRFIMHLIKKVLRRGTGMGFKIMKFHAIIHMADDIKLYGIPQEHDTGANESGHKVTKVAAKLTQKNIRTFEIQTARRLVEFIIILWAIAELEGKRLWEYYGDHDPMNVEGTALVVVLDDDVRSDDESSTTASTLPMHELQSALDENEQRGISTGGTMLDVYWVDLGDERFPMLGWKAKTIKMRRHPDLARVRYGSDIVDFLIGLQDMIEDVLGMEEDSYELPIYTEHKRDGYTFRGHPDYRSGGPWRDWAMIEWGDGYGTLPCQIWCFVKLEGLPEDSEGSDEDAPGTGYKYGGIYLENGTYAVVECGHWDEEQDEVAMSDLFVPFFKDKRGKKRKFYLADVEAIERQMCVVPDIGCQGGNRYFQVKSRAEWVDEFEAWVKDPHNLDAF